MILPAAAFPFLFSGRGRCSWSLLIVAASCLRACLYLLPLVTCPRLVRTSAPEPARPCGFRPGIAAVESRGSAAVVTSSPAALLAVSATSWRLWRFVPVKSRANLLSIFVYTSSVEPHTSEPLSSCASFALCSHAFALSLFIPFCSLLLLCQSSIRNQCRTINSLHNASTLTTLTHYHKVSINCELTLYI